MLKMWNLDLLNENDDKIDEKRENIFKKADKQNYIMLLDTYIVFFERNQSKVEEIIDIKLENTSDFSEFIHIYDNGECYEIPNTQIEISISSCIDVLINNIEDYEQRIFYSNDCDDETWLILKELLLPVCQNKILEIQKALYQEKENIKNGEFEWH